MHLLVSTMFLSKKNITLLEMSLLALSSFTIAESLYYWQLFNLFIYSYPKP